MPTPSGKTTPPTKTAPLSAAPLTSEIQPVTCPKGTFRYTIQSGDTLWKLSQAYGVSTQSILDVNPGINPQNLQIGSTLCIPTAQTVPAPSGKTAPPTKTAPMTLVEIQPVTCPKGAFRYTIQSGDTLWKLSQAYGVSIQDILDVNPGINPQNLQIGSTLCIPTAQTVPAPSGKTVPMTSEIQPVTCPKGTFGYTIQSGDTLWKLSQDYGVNIQDILDVNPGINPQNLQIGSTLCIPTAQTVPAPSAKTAPYDFGNSARNLPKGYFWLHDSEWRHPLETLTGLWCQYSEHSRCQPRHKPAEFTDWLDSLHSYCADGASSVW